MSSILYCIFRKSDYLFIFVNYCLHQELGKSTLNFLLEKGTGMPITFGEHRHSSSAKLFSNRKYSELQIGECLEHGIGGSMSVGVHHTKITTQETLRDGQIRHGTHRDVGGQLNGAGVASISAGLRNGRTNTEPVTVTDADGVATQSMTKYRYSGQINVSLQVGEQSRSFQIFPSYESHTQKISHIYRDDKKPISSKLNEPLKHLSSAVSNEKSPQGAFTEAHVTLVEALFDAVHAGDGRQEFVTDIEKVDHKRKKYFFFSRKWSEETVHGYAHEQSSSIGDTTTYTSAEHGEEFRTEMRTEHLTSVMREDRILNKRGQETSPSAKHESVRDKYAIATEVFTKSNKAAYDTRPVTGATFTSAVTSPSTAATMSTAVTTRGDPATISLSGREVDTARIVETSPNLDLDSNGKRQPGTVRREYKSGASTLSGSTAEPVKKFQGGHTRTVNKVSINQVHKDLRIETTEDGNNQATTTHFRAGEKREQQGTVSKTTSKFTKSLTAGSLTIEHNIESTTSVHGFVGEASDAQPMQQQVVATTKEKHGLFTVESHTTEEVITYDATGKEAERTSKDRRDSSLSAPGTAGLWALCDGCYDIIGNLFFLMREKSTEKQQELWLKVIRKGQTIGVDVFETTGIAYCSEVGAATMVHGDGLPYAIAIALISLVARSSLTAHEQAKTKREKRTVAETLKNMSLMVSGLKKKSWAEILSDTKSAITNISSNNPLATSDAVFKVLQLSCQFMLVWAELPYGTPVIFGCRQILQIVHGSYLVCAKQSEDIFQGGMSW